MSILRARCPECRTLTAVALEPEYQCHSCGREFAAGLVRVPRAWGSGGEAMAESAWLPLPYPETGVIEQGSLAAQSEELAGSLPARPLVLGGCCCAHVGAVKGLAERGLRVAVVWLDAHGDLNTAESSPSGNEWGMPLRMLLDEGVVRPDDVALVGARNLDPPEAEYVAAMGIDDDADRAAADTDAVYVALDADVLDPSAIDCFMPEPHGLTIEEASAVLRRVGGGAPPVGAGITGLRPDAEIGVLIELMGALGL